MKLGFLIAALVVVGVMGGILLVSNSDTNQTTQISNSIQRQDMIKSSSNQIPSKSNCDESYPSVCIPPYPPDLDCGEISYSNFRTLQPDPHGFDRDKDGVGCER